MERDYEVRTERGGTVAILGYFLIFILVLAEWREWSRLNGESLEGIVVDTRLVLVFAWNYVIANLCMSFMNCKPDIC